MLFKRVIICHHKDFLKGDILIDDGPHNMQGGEYRKILFSANHNLDFDEASVNAVRVTGWDEVLEAVEKIREEIEKERT